MFNSTKVVDYLGLKEVNGDVGIEVEAEIANDFYDLSHTRFNNAVWKQTTDGSLRGYGYEFVSRGPMQINDVPRHVGELEQYLNSESVILPSVRAGVHVHVNMQQSSIADLFRFVMCYYPLETVLTKFCGEGREGNLFCLRAREATYISEALQHCVEVGDLNVLRTSNLRYSALNFQSLFKFGSLESRALGTVPDLSNIYPWCRILMRLKEYSENVTSCWDEMNKISGNGPEHWAKEVLGDELFALVEYPEMHHDIIQDVREFQFLAHLLDQKGI